MFFIEYCTNVSTTIQWSTQGEPSRTILDLQVRRGVCPRDCDSLLPISGDQLSWEAASLTMYDGVAAMVTGRYSRAVTRLRRQA